MNQRWLLQFVYILLLQLTNLIEQISVPFTLQVFLMITGNNIIV